LVSALEHVGKHRRGQLAIAEQVGISRMTLRRIAHFHGITLNSRTS
jgi:hypothetical protein